MQNVFPAQGQALPSTSSESHESVLARAERMLTQLRSGPSTLPRNRRHHRRRIGKSKEHQRNLVVIDYPGPSAPAVQTLHNYDKVYEGVLRFDGSMTEVDVREEICRLARDTDNIMHDLSQISTQDFNFVRVINRRVRKPGGMGVYDGSGLKELYRSGSIYVQLVRSFDKHEVLHV
jgi:hypothetical protein